MTEFQSILALLSDAQVEFILVGGLAAVAHGSARATQDVDVVYARTPANLERLASCLKPYHPYLRGAPEGLPFVLDEATLLHGLNFTLTTDLGELDLLGEIVGGGNYSDLLLDSIVLEVFSRSCRCLSLSQLIRAKRSAGRPKDLEAIAELESIRGP